MIRLECYIEEYMTEGGLCARLREKESDNIIIFENCSADEKRKFLQFLTSAKLSEPILSELFVRFGEDCVAVYAEKIVRSKNGITIYADSTNFGYLIE